jgi:type II secretory pathway component PulF
MNTDALARHLAALLEDSDRLDTAIEKLKTACAANRHTDIDALHAVLAGRAGPVVGNDYSSVLPQLLAATGDSAAHRVAAFRTFQKLLQVWRDNQQACWAGLYRGLSYYGVMILAALGVFSLFANLVIPQFEVLFLEMAGNARMPVVTRAVFGGSGWLLIVPALAVASLYLSLLVFAVHFRRRMHRLEPLAPISRRLPLARAIAVQYQHALAFIHARILIDAGLTPGQAIQAGSRLAGGGHDAGAENWSPGSELAETLHVAAALGHLREEIDFQVDRQIEETCRIVASTYQRLSVLLRIVLYTTVALLIVAMYQPIFSLGAVI